ncbi:phage tail protein [Aurantimonas sp. VKM B-3413]|uniref:phage tail protein n=1 Tax=Aurantimonas sp. VKM B-3413 TaxID=2779401 RepID=UPI001E5F2462|nr:phage tail protein [Aurantimonas sp. VKM B-3413]MCB8835922.1 phage tail protein [Aurantimonas sp. VKM B-3413]
MLYMIGPIMLDTFPFNADKFERRAKGDYAVKPVIGSLPPREPMGEGDDVITLSGQLLPFKIGGLTELALADQLRITQTALPAMRGDGGSLGWRVIDEIRESHEDLMRNGVGFAVQYQMQLTKVPVPSSGTGAGVISMIASLFGALGG